MLFLLAIIKAIFCPNLSKVPSYFNEMRLISFTCNLKCYDLFSSYLFFNKVYLSHSNYWLYNMKAGACMVHIGGHEMVCVY
jgi:hypothetical protein